MKSTTNGDTFKKIWNRVFICPVCEQSLLQIGPCIKCVNAHTFDIAREGYVNLLLPQHRKSKSPGYDDKMIASRREVFKTGCYEQLANRIATIASSHISESVSQVAISPVVLDVGCGEGYYLRILGNRAQQMNMLRCGIDISKPAIKAAAKSDSTGLYAVASIYNIPVLSNQVDILVTHFSPISTSEFQRVIRPNGILIIGSPAEDHLFELKKLLYISPEKHEQLEPLAGDPNFTLVSTDRVQYEFELCGPGQVANLLRMTPFYWSASKAAQNSFETMESIKSVIDVNLHVYRKIN